MTIRGWDGRGAPSIGLVKPPCQVVIVRPAESDDPNHSSGRVCSWTAIKPSFQTPAAALLVRSLPAPGPARILRFDRPS